MKTILITDSLFIHQEHEQKLRDAGYEIERLDKPQSTEEELIAAVKGKAGYILGGTEQITQRIIDAADELKVISFTGIGYKDFIPAWEYALEKGIAITNAPDGPTHAVAEWAITMALVMNRRIFELGRAGSNSFKTTPGLEGQNIGIIGYGRIGTEISEMLKVFRPASISYFSAHRHEDKEQITGAEYKPLDLLLRESDVVFVCVSKEAGENFIDAEQLSKMKDGALLVSFMHHGIVNEDALLKELQSSRLRAVSDYPAHNETFKSLPLSHWFCFNGSNAFNTIAEIKQTSDMVVESLLNVLSTGDDKYLVNKK